MGGGRQREFDKQEALDAAMHVFWEKGYAGASLSELTAVMGINKPSLYATFGNKEQLFISATEHYMEHYVQPHIAHLNEEGHPLKARVKNYLMSIITEQCNEKGAKGCYVSLCVSEAASEHFPEKAKKVAADISHFSESFLKDFFEKELSLKQLPPNTDCILLSRFIVTFLHGTAAMARANRSLEELEGLIDMALEITAI